MIGRGKCILHIALAIALLAGPFTHSSIAKTKPRPAPKGPPIVVLTPEEAEPRRDVPASEWKSPYCIGWNDGCTECTIDEKGKKQCQPMKDRDITQCTPRPNSCQYTGDIYRYCSYFISTGNCLPETKRGWGDRFWPNWEFRNNKWQHYTGPSGESIVRCNKSILEKYVFPNEESKRNYSVTLCEPWTKEDYDWFVKNRNNPKARDWFPQLLR